MLRVHPSRHVRKLIEPWLSVWMFALSSCFNSDSLLYSECRREADDCSPAGSEPRRSIIPRACFTPRADSPGYCVPRSDAARSCEPPDYMQAASGDDLAVACYTVEEPGPPTIPYEACVLICEQDPDCPATMACKDYDGLPDGVRVCIPTGQ